MSVSSHPEGYRPAPRWGKERHEDRKADYDYDYEHDHEHEREREREHKFATGRREEMFGDRPVLVMEAELKSGTKIVLTFDLKTGLLVRMNETVFEEYREVDGMLFPFVIKARPGTEARFERMDNNAAVEAEHFDPPTS